MSNSNLGIWNQGKEEEEQDPLSVVKGAVPLSEVVPESEEEKKRPENAGDECKH